MFKFKKVICSSLLILSTTGLVANANAANNWDVDNNSEVDALTDGLLMLRYSFGLKDAALTNGAIGANSPLSQSELESELFAIQGISDIDGNGQKTTRFLFELIQSNDIYRYLG
jgi:hypothetical protein